jgi:hypothetical protein
VVWGGVVVKGPLVIWGGVVVKGPLVIWGGVVVKGPLVVWGGVVVKGPLVVWGGVVNKALRYYSDGPGMKAVSLHNGNTRRAVPLVHAVYTKETNANVYGLLYRCATNITSVLT